ncbi:DUF6979 family protein [Polaribacter marinivivus]|uniref:DUF6979 family protein n=1 Tax=Polaribacter marinivivus TaxID=1524260 RepID=A0ABV8R7V9_9FLAO
MKSKINKYGLTALKSVENYKNYYSIIEIWSRASKEVFETKSSQEKSCPKNTFLGLCEAGLVKGVPKGNYTKSVKNKRYALKAVKVLISNPNKIFTSKELWEQLELEDKKHNSQMDVILALWENDLIVK